MAKQYFGVNTITYTNKNELRESVHSSYYSFEHAVEELKRTVNYHLKVNKLNGSRLTSTEYQEDRVVHHYANNYRIEHTISIQEDNSNKYINVKFSI